MKHECSGCPYWKWHPRDMLYDAPGHHRCEEPDFCDRFRKKKIQRNAEGFITDECIQDMRDSLPIGVFVGVDNKQHRVIKTPQELEEYLFGALPYVLTTYFRKED